MNALINVMAGVCIVLASVVIIAVAAKPSIPWSFNGRTRDFESRDAGSIPEQGAKNENV